MPPTYAQNKIHIYKWRESNKDAYRAIVCKSQKKYLAWKKIKFEFLSILID